jgi:peptide/nickel transport system permease protein
MSSVTIPLGRILRTGSAKAGIVIIVGVLGFIFGVVLLPHHPPLAFVGPPDSPPSLRFPFGTDFLGHDLLSQVAFGAFPTLSIGLIAALGGTLIGFFLGLYGGYYNAVQPIISGTIDVVLSFPSIVLLILIASLFTASNQLIALSLILILWATVARGVRAQVASLKKLPYVDASRTSGMSDWRIVNRVIAPAVAPIAISYFVLTISIGIVIATSVQWIGLGNVTQVSWGSILYYAELYAFVRGDWWWVVEPGLMLALIAIGFSLIGFAIEEELNPRLRVYGEKLPAESLEPISRV